MSTISRIATVAGLLGLALAASAQENAELSGRLSGPTGELRVLKLTSVLKAQPLTAAGSAALAAGAKAASPRTIAPALAAASVPKSAIPAGPVPASAASKTPKLGVGALKALTEIDPKLSGALMDGDDQKLHQLIQSKIVEALSRPGKKISILKLRMGQDKVGLHEVLEKKAIFSSLKKKGEKKKIEKLLQSEHYVIPTIRAPKKLGRGDGATDKKVRVVIDHHHEADALRRAGIKKAYESEVFDFSHMSAPVFWEVAQALQLVLLQDKDGKSIKPSQLARNVRDLKNDPFRSIAGDVRKKGGYKKNSKPFSEFAWADFLRTRVKTDPEKDYDGALAEALALAKTDEAKGLPGYIGGAKN